MTGHLSLKWNNHSSSLLRSLTKVQTKEQYCDATIACQGKYFPVHRIVLSTCSEYFEEIFERIQNQHPYIIFKDIEPREMELLLNYMYQGEVNVLQENLPMLIKAAEALKIKGLAVPDDVPAKEPPLPTKKRSSNSNEYPHAKRRPEEKRKRRESNDGHSSNNENDENYSKCQPKSEHSEELKVIKEEPVDTSYEDNDLNKNFQIPITEEKIADTNNEMQDFTSLENVNFTKDGNIVPSESFENQSSSWSTYNEGDQVGNLSAQDDIPGGWQGIGSSLTGNDDMLSVDPDTLEVDRDSMTRCPFCEYKSKFKRNVSRHIMFKHTKERPFACGSCGKRFTNKESLQRHTLIHTGEKPYQCSSCLLRFRHCSSLKTHKLSNPNCS